MKRPEFLAKFGKNYQPDENPEKSTTPNSHQSTIYHLKIRKSHSKISADEFFDPTIGPTKDRKRNTTWNQFIKQHKDILWATDFFTTEVWSKSGLNTFYVLFFIHLQSRNVVLGSITTSPNEQWMKQVAKNITGWDGESRTTGRAGGMRKPP